MSKSPFAAVAFSAGFGLITAGRSTTGLAALTTSAKNGPLFAIGAVGELIADKLPQTPSRARFPGILGRTVAGAANGFLVAKHLKASPLPCVIAGATTATVGAYAGVEWRKFATNKFGADYYGALIEDAVVLSAAVFVAKALRS